MSMEQAILEHAGALRELAAAIKSTGGADLRKAEMMAGVHLQEAMGAGRELKEKAAELAEARTERVAATKEAAAQDAKANEKPTEVKPDAELDKAVEQVEQAALDYKKDVYPVLLQVSKTKGKEALRGLLDKFGAKTGDSLKADQFAAIVADGNALLAA